MAPEPVAAERAYRLLKFDILVGRFRPGSPIIERQAALEYGMSISPLRDAAHRLVGEQVLETGQAGGYRVPVPTPRGLRDLYAWHSHLVRLILKDDARSQLTVQVNDVQGLNEVRIAMVATDMFRAVADSAGNLEHGRALRSATERLMSARLCEVMALGNLERELDGIAEILVSGSDRNRFAVLRAYHRRRIRRADKIAQMLKSLASF